MRNSMIEDAVNTALKKIMESILVGEMKIKKYDAAGMNIEVLSYGSWEKEYREYHSGGLGDGCPYESSTEYGVKMGGKCVLSIDDDVFGLNYSAKIQLNGGLKNSNSGGYYKYDKYSMMFWLSGRDLNKLKGRTIMNAMMSTLDMIDKDTHDHKEQYRPLCDRDCTTISRSFELFNDILASEYESGTDISPEMTERILNKNKKINKVKGCGFPKKYRHLLED